MKVSPVAVFAVLLAFVTVTLFPVRPSLAWAADGKTMTMAAADPAKTTPAQKEPRIVDANSVFFGCAVGAALGALVTAMPPLVGWTLYAGALPSIVAVIATSGVGCTVGLFGGVVLSTLDWVFGRIGAAWRAVFG
jgi:hypothetical protein